MMPRGSKKAARARQARSGKAGHDEEFHGHGHVEFRLSRRTSEAIEAALTGLTLPQRGRVTDAIDRVGAEAGQKGARWVERNVIGNANALLAAMTDSLAADGHWDHLRAIWAFLGHLDVPIDHARVAKAIEKQEGPELAGRYRDAAGVKAVKKT